MKERFTIIEPRHCTGTILLYDNLLDKVCIEISTGNQQMNRIMMKACTRIMHGENTIRLEELI